MNLRKSIKPGVIGAVLLICAASLSQAQDTATGEYAYVGSRTTKERNARGNGIEIYQANDTDGWQHRETVGDLVNPSFLILNADRTLLFTVHGDLEAASSFRVDLEQGGLVKLSTVSTEGTNPVHLALDRGEKYLIVANYKTGTVVSLPVSDEGTLGAVVSKIGLPGEAGPHRQEQTASHPHQVLPDSTGQRFIVPDKGLDKIFVLSADENGGLAILSEVVTREGAGPRHAAFSPDGRTVYVVNELDSTLAAYHYDDGRLEPFQVVSTLPDDFTGNSRGAAIIVSPDGGHVYATNRGHDSVVRFVIDRVSGRMSDPVWIGSGGERPRFMTLAPSGKDILVANELSDTIISFAIAEGSGTLSNPQVVARTGSPVSIAFGSTTK
ncbi:MAG: lactonase family protein [Paracoccus sp. (in: a-proteobacteria)]|uniref:lactonase family protein n=1 Tax=Paracoccus sp. TaxID=267 RepID=UPI0026DFB5D6|nr:lactonase family protein [Paracoccus sp. (in: a-proteobacteria)]MDO5633065.1 lactonase family protein [Paracoccus sp. (in: a-proteobacteria)]